MMRLGYPGPRPAAARGYPKYTYRIFEKKSRTRCASLPWHQCQCICAPLPLAPSVGSHRRRRRRWHRVQRGAATAARGPLCHAAAHVAQPPAAAHRRCRFGGARASSLLTREPLSCATLSAQQQLYMSCTRILIWCHRRMQRVLIWRCFPLAQARCS